MKKYLSVCLLLFGLNTQASELRTVLMSSGYGAGAGALVGVTALAFSENPSGNLSLISKGASLGLYAGLAVGIYLASQEKSKERSWAVTMLSSEDKFVVPGIVFNSHF